MKDSPARIHAALFLVAVLFSLNYIISKVAMRTLSPLAFAWLRVAGSAILLEVTARRQLEPLTRRDWLSFTGLAFLGVVINQTMFLTGLSFTSAHIAAILITTIPVFALAIAIVLKRERATVWKIGGIVVSAAGALLVVGFEGIEGSGKSLAGAVMLIINCLSYAAYLVASKPVVTRLSPRLVVGRVFSIGAVCMLPFAAHALLTQDWHRVTPGAWLSLAAVIAGPTVGAYVLSGWALARADTSLVAVYTYVQPVLTTILAAIFLSETLQPVVALAAIMIFTGVWMASRKASAR